MCEKYPTLSESIIRQNGQPMLSTRQITLCFRSMPRYNRDYRLIHTKKLLISMEGANCGFTVFTNPANSSRAAEYHRHFSLCNPRTPGIWTSMCLGMNFTQTTQLVRAFQDGKRCSERTYTGHFDLLYFPRGNSIETM